jgi:hypothetical protein
MKENQEEAFLGRNAIIFITNSEVITESIWTMKAKLRLCLHLHFNPVDLVCGIKSYKKKFDLTVDKTVVLL